MGKLTLVVLGLFGLYFLFVLIGIILMTPFFWGLLGVIVAVKIVLFFRRRSRR